MKKIMILITFMFIFMPFARADIDIEKLSAAIHLAENSKSHPCGIMTKYKNTTPKQACINTIKHALKDYKEREDEENFIKFLGNRYAPISANNDPHNLNKNWVKNVTYYYFELTS